MEEQPVAIEMRLPHLELSLRNRDTSKVKIFTGRANPQLADEIGAPVEFVAFDLEHAS
ncbi:MAG: hypothetical protein K2X66_13355 [Cyanobacteria bacterium]|nr:hypothetical protein [Cyanobacteriota bacterium]